MHIDIYIFSSSFRTPLFTDKYISINYTRILGANITCMSLRLRLNSAMSSANAAEARSL